MSFQQSSRCYSCTNCGATGLGRINCGTGEDDDDNVGPPTTPTSPLGFSAKNVSLDGFFPIAPMNSTNSTTTATTAIIESTNAQFSCFTVILDSKYYKIDIECKISGLKMQRDLNYVQSERGSKLNLPLYSLPSLLTI